MWWEPDDTDQRWSFRITQKILAIHATWVDLERVILREVSQRRTIERRPFYEDSKKTRYKSTYETQGNSQT